jgi:hypothetical protein
MGLAEVRIYTATDTIEGWVDVDRQRLSDVLNVEDLLSVSRVAVGPRGEDWFVVDREQMLIVVAPPRPTDRKVRLHRMKRPVMIQTGPYEVRGSVHLIAGIALDPMLARSRQYFLPVTDARIIDPVREIDDDCDVALVNVRVARERLKLEVVE